MEEKDLATHLENIEKKLDIIARHTGGTWHSIWISILKGIGIVAGTILAILLLGWILSLLGFVPGLGAIASHLHAILSTKYGG